MTGSNDYLWEELRRVQHENIALEKRINALEAELTARSEVDDWQTAGNDWRSVYRSRNDGLLHAVRIMADNAMAKADAMAPDYPSLAAALKGAK